VLPGKIRKAVAATTGKIKMSIYLDYAATTPVDPLVTKAMFDWQTNNFGNPSSPHRHGQIAKINIEEVRDKIAGCLNCLPKEVTFTSGGTEANNLALLGTALAHKKKGNHIVISATEHPSVISAGNTLKKYGFEVSWINPNHEGVITLENLEKAVRENTIFVSVMYVNNETGIISPISAIGAFCRQRDILFHCDAVQAFGKMPTDIKELNSDLLTFSAHKIYGPKGVGGVFIRSGVNPDPLIYGGGQEANRRPGTENITGITGLGKAVELMQNAAEQWKYVFHLKQLFEKELKVYIPENVINGNIAKRSPYISNVSFPGLDNQSLLLALDLNGLSVSVGSACSSGSIRQSHVLQAMGLGDEIVSSSVRFSFGRFTTESEINKSLEILKKTILKLRK
jgi:cysteine desulfurase